ncbi:hybrid sensor histidine kinase/response regulator [Parapedobacter sp. ISTM3]|uniref:histidine kinase n=1 Tax=Parapedobacter luteus TaxID=623280 RepID=A0A1T5D8H9_9SPHI|nr:MULTISPECIES: hybrid sensor histidine kinase/response regulator [Parapedobacter]MBK1438531.1 hybrid sensor histidine kinase/response regulator [Parapedobacter sp. ISTM3]SKB68088.1 Signal transduction histidine kinase [Parapedobacter luteus]
MILIVDDKIENIKALKKILTAQGFEVDTASSGEEALKKVLKNDYQLVILDVQMPGMDGFEVAEAISGISKTSELPIIFLSAVNVSKAFITKGYTSGGHDYLVKPIDPDILVLKIKMFIKLQEQAKELARTQQELRNEIAHRIRAEEKKDEFIGMASHEVKTPLTSVKAYIQLAGVAIHDNKIARALQFINKANNQVDKLNHMMTELLDIAKMESGRLDFNLSEFNLNQLLDDVLDIFQQSNPEREVIRSGNADIVVRGDALRLEQVILNYLSNAAKYSPETEKIHLDACETPDNEIRISVKDHGIGIDKKEQVNLFTKFYRTKQSSAEYRGLGMGLYLCAEIVKFHGGKYGVESQLEKGSTFYFTLPASARITVNTPPPQTS